MKDNGNFILGINYWPRRKAMGWWSAFDSGEVRDEFSLINELGLQVVRIFLLWDDFQPNPVSISSSALSLLIKTADIAAEFGLKLDITFFTGHMSGPNWAPRWLMDRSVPSASPYFEQVGQVISGRRVIPGGRYRNPFTDKTALDAEDRLLAETASALKGHPALWLWNLGNEPDLFAWPENHRAGADWIQSKTAVLRSVTGTNTPITIGLHMDSLCRDNGFRVDSAFAAADQAVMHSYPMYTPWARGPLDPDFVPFTVALTGAISGKRVLMEEFGGCTAPKGESSTTWKWTSYGKSRDQFMAGEEEFAEYIGLVLPKLHQNGALGAFLWCFADYHESLWNSPPCLDSRHERHFGLVRPDGSLKPHAEVLKKFAAGEPRILPVPLRAQFPELWGQSYYEKSLFNNLPDLYAGYLSRN
jgi:endo-1,4-beta-mannosidase